MPVLNRADRLYLGARRLDAVHADTHRVWPMPLPFLEADVGQVSTPDTANDHPMSGDWRMRFKLRATAVPAQRGVIAMQRAATASNIAWDLGEGTTANIQWRWGVADGSGLNGPSPIPNGSVIVGQDQWFGARIERSGASTNAHYVGEQSTDGGASWHDIAAVDSANGMATFDSTAPITVAGLPGSAQRFPGRIYWCEMTAIHRAWIDFAGQSSGIAVAGGAGLGAWPDPLEILTRVTISDPEATPGAGNFPTILGRRPTATNDYDLLWRRYSSARQLNVAWKDGAGAAQSFVSNAWAAGAIAANTPVWLRCTMTATTVAIAYSLANTFDPPATADASWVSLGSTARATPGITGAQSTASLRIGQTQASPGSWRGRNLRTLIRRQDTGAVWVDNRQSDAWKAAATGPTPGAYTAWSGQACTVAGTNPIVPQADAVVWRFDASEWPPAALALADPRGRAWTATVSPSHPASQPDSEVA